MILKNIKVKTKKNILGLGKLIGGWYNLISNKLGLKNAVKVNNISKNLIYSLKSYCKCKKGD